MSGRTHTLRVLNRAEVEATRQDARSGAGLSPARSERVAAPRRGILRVDPDQHPEVRTVRTPRRGVLRERDPILFTTIVQVRREPHCRGCAQRIQSGSRVILFDFWPDHNSRFPVVSYLHAEECP